MSLVHKPIDKWTDVDMKNAELKLNEYSKKMIDLRSLKLATMKIKKTLMKQMMMFTHINYNQLNLMLIMRKKF